MFVSIVYIYYMTHDYLVYHKVTWKNSKDKI